MRVKLQLVMCNDEGEEETVTGLDHRVGHPTPFEPSPLPAAED